MTDDGSSQNGDSLVRFRMHPRAFEALGKKLVTSDVVAVIELVKNAYDACATNAWVRLLLGEGDAVEAIEIEDDGTGMTREVIEDVWCVAATPYRAENPTSKKGRCQRRVSGEKGLGRLSAMRLGGKLTLWTRSHGEPCWEVNVDWDALSAEETIEQCAVRIRRCDNPPLTHVGTLLRLTRLHSEWPEADWYDLSQRLGRLVSPCSKGDTFEIWFQKPGDEQHKTQVEVPPYVDKPPYALLEGSVDEAGVVNCMYVHDPLEGQGRRKRISRSVWPPDSLLSPPLAPRCGPFTFELQAWDMDNDMLSEIADRFGVKNATTVRGDIKAHAGILLYRDGVLVLPKTDRGRDWLGLDRRRTSLLGRRIDSRQTVGWVEITADDNPEIGDTSDRERLQDNDGADDFRRLLTAAVGLLETEREIDRTPEVEKDRPFKSLLSALSAGEVVKRVRELAAEGRSADEAASVIEDYHKEAEKTLHDLERRLVHYSRLATVGAIAEMLVHEVGNQGYVLGNSLRFIAKHIPKDIDKREEVDRKIALAETALRSLDRLADRFAPLATRAYATRRRDSIVEELIDSCVEALRARLDRGGISVRWPRDGQTKLAVDPGELVAIIYNLLDNAAYWLTHSEGAERIVEFRIVPAPEEGRVVVEVHDSGPGIEVDDEERIFLPGFTRKSEGIGMGLTVVAEIVSQYGGQMSLVQPGVLGGASFQFDLPASRRAT